MSIKFHDVEQGTQEWHDARRGIATTSEFQKVLSPRAGKDGIGRKTYMRKLAGEIITGNAFIDPYNNAAMQRGKEMEDEARKYYVLTRPSTEKPQRVGFVTNGRMGCSPDSLIGGRGLLEIKTAYPHILIEYLERQHEKPDYIPAEHIAQVQGAMLVTGREWCDLIVYWPEMPAFVSRVTADGNYQQALKESVDLFNIELDNLVNFLRSIDT